MPPPYDNIADALELSGMDQQITLDNTGATMETNEEDYSEGYPSLWLKIDLSDPNYQTIYGNDIPVIMSSEAPPGSPVLPYLDFYYVADASFDPANPDFSLLQYSIGDYVGDGTSNPPTLNTTLDPSDSAVFGIFYVFVGDWNGINEGDQIITYSIPTPPIVYEINDITDWNHDSGTVTDLGGGSIKETQLLQWDNGDTDIRGSLDAVWTFRIPTELLPPKGKYYIWLDAQLDGAYSFAAQWYFYMLRNDEPLFPHSHLFAQDDVGKPTPKTLWRMTGEIEAILPYIGGFPTYSQGHGPTTVPINPEEDEIKFVVVNSKTVDNDDGSYIKIHGIKFVVKEYGGFEKTINLSTMPRQTLANNADGRTDPTDNVQQMSMCILDNDDIYIFYRANTGPPNYYDRLRFVKYSGGAWSTVSSDVSHAQNGPNWNADRYGQVSMATDGTYLWLAWGEPDRSYSKQLHLPGGALTGLVYGMKFHVKKYTPGVGFEELGSGQCKKPLIDRYWRATVDSCTPDTAGYENSIQIKISPNGVPWVVTGETDDAYYGGNIPPTAPLTRPYAWYWDGNQWVDSEMPEPPNVDLVNQSEGGYLNYINVDAQHQIDLTFCHHDGPSEYPSVIYCLGSYDLGRETTNQRFIYQEHDGNSWGNLIDTHAMEIWPGATYTERFHPTWTGGAGQQGMALDNDGKTPIFAAALWTSWYVDQVKVAKTNEDGTALIEYSRENSFLRSPDSVWRDGKNSTSSYDGGGGWSSPTGCDMAIGPDRMPWVIFTGTWWEEWGIQLVRFGEEGTEDLWMLGSRQNSFTYGENSYGFSCVECKGDYVYVGSVWYLSGQTFLNVFKAHINDPYKIWTALPPKKGYFRTQLL